MIRTDASEIVASRAVHHDVAAFGMAAATVKLTVRNVAHANAGADSDVANVLFADASTLQVFAIGRHVHVSGPNEFYLRIMLLQRA